MTEFLYGLLMEIYHAFTAPWPYLAVEAERQQYNGQRGGLIMLVIFPLVGIAGLLLIRFLGPAYCTRILGGHDFSTWAPRLSNKQCRRCGFIRGAK